MNFKKFFTNLRNINFEQGFLRLAVLATPIWLIFFWMYENKDIGKSKIEFSDLTHFGDFLAIGIFYAFINPITFYIFTRWIVIPPIKWVLKGFSDND